MKYVSLFFLFLAGQAFAFSTVVTGIAKIEEPFEDSDLLQVLAFYEGRIFEIDKSETEALGALKRAQKEQLKVELTLAQESLQKKDFQRPQIISAKLLTSSSDKFKAKSSLKSASSISSYHSDYTPTNVSSLAEAEKMFDWLYKSNNWFTECYNRAHIWSRQLDKDFGVKSEKIIIYYTRKYRNYDRRWNWWFHLAPMVRVNGQEVVLDKHFANGPLSQYDWEKEFNGPMRDFGKRCKRISKISSYYSDDNNRNEYCNIQVAPMYYWEPSQLKRLENEGVVKDRWDNSEIKHAAIEAFFSWRPIFRKYKVP